MPFPGFAATKLSGLDFWYFENLENQELRGEATYQLNTRPLLINAFRASEESPSGFVFDNLRLEYSHSSLIPFVQKRGGNWITNGQNLLISSQFGYVSEIVSVWIEPRLSIHENKSMDEYSEGRYLPISDDNITRYPTQSGEYSEATLNKAHLLVPFSNWYFFFGKGNLQFGAGKHDTLHLSNSAAAFPMIRLGTQKPWDSVLGFISFLTYIGELEPERHIPRARFSGFRLDWSTSKRLEIGISRSWMAGGDGQNNSFSHVFGDLYSEFYKPVTGIEKKGDFRNQQLVFDFRVKIPEINAVVYGEYGREDHEHSYDGVIKRWYHTQANIIGIKLIDLFTKNLFWIIERADNVERYPFPEYIPWFETEDDPAPAPRAWYNHSEYKDGWTYEDICLGHHMGADSVDEFIAIGWGIPSHSIMLYYDRETHGVLTVNEKNQEQKTEIGIDGFIRWRDHWRFDYLLQHQQFTNFGEVAGHSVESNVFSISATYLF